MNENLPEIIKEHGGDTRKVYYDALIDDKSADKRKYGLPFRAGKAVADESESRRKARFV